MHQKSDGPSDRSSRTDIENGAGKISRRTAMTMMSAVATVPATAFIPTASKASTRPVSRAAWDTRLGRLQAIQAEYDEINAAHSAAFDAAEAECPREEEFFRRYNLGCYDDKARGRERNERTAAWAIYSERLAALVRSGSERRNLTDEEIEEAKRDAEKVVDRFDAWCTARDEAHDRHHCDQWERRFDALFDRRYKAQEAVLATPAPDQTALLVKFDILTAMMDGEQDLSRVELLQADARRFAAN
jgi:hypothetical protein